MESCERTWGLLMGCFVQGNGPSCSVKVFVAVIEFGSSTAIHCVWCVLYCLCSFVCCVCLSVVCYLCVVSYCSTTATS
jgi:hypothetical protein